jgi:alginate O-acetyltransferase complex protein AlgI
MNFVSIEFVLLIVVVLVLMLIVKNFSGRKVVLLLASCFFYAYWDWRFLGLLILITVVDFYISINISATLDPGRKRSFLIASLVLNLLVLGIFKYSNFFIDSLDLILQPLGVQLPELKVILPIGISFYVFETLSYVIDVYRGNAKPANSLLDYAVFITFFPRLVAGPIMRASQFLPQLENGITLSRENFLTGGHLFGQGLIKKVVVANSMAVIVDKIYAGPLLYSSATIWLAVLSYSIQIYFDFSGYSDMAMGVARLFGIQLPVNFNLPYTSASLSEFWQRWHISLSTWLRDYLYIPLGGSRKGDIRTYVNLMITMVLGGLWHGASWNFVFWGGLHGAGLTLERAIAKNDRGAGANFGQVKTWFRVVAVFLLVTLAWVFFRSPSVEITRQMFSKLLFLNSSGVSWMFLPALVYLVIVLVAGIAARVNLLGQAPLDWGKPYVLPLICAQFLLAFVFAANHASPFIYFQF